MKTKSIFPPLAVIATAFTLAVGSTLASEAKLKKLDESSEKWRKTRAQCVNSYSYQVRTASFSGVVSTTTITVTAGKVIKREYEEFNGEDAPAPGKPEPAKVRYSEEGAQIGKDPRGASVLTLDELYAEAKDLLETPLAAHEKRYMHFDKSGLLASCYTMDSRDANGAPINGLTVSNIKPAAPTPAFVLLEGLRPNSAAFADSSVARTLELKSVNECEKYFDGNSISKIKSSVEFDQQIILVVAWRGSGQDDLVAAATEEGDVTFTYRRGRSRDLRPHTRVFAVSVDAKWEVQ